MCGLCDKPQPFDVDQMHKYGKLNDKLQESFSWRDAVEMDMTVKGTL